MRIPQEWNPLQKEALQQAKELWDAQRVALEKWNRIEPGQFTWNDIDPLERQFWVEAQMDILSDLGREASRDFWVRWMLVRNPHLIVSRFRDKPAVLLREMAVLDFDLKSLLKEGE